MMKYLTLDYAHKYVLQTLDELKNLGDISMLTEGEELDTLKLTEGFIVESVLKAHRDAPSHLVDGIKGTQGEDYSVSVTDYVATIKMLKESARLASLKADDSTVVVVDYATEETPIGKMQKNIYVRGTYDDPRLIVKKYWENDRKPEYEYYSVTSSGVKFDLEYVPYPVLTDSGVQISDKLEYAVLNLLVAMVMDALSIHDKANLHRNRYTEYLQATR